MLMRPHRPFLPYLVPLLVLSLGSKAANEGRVYEASRHGVVSGPLGAPSEPRTGLVARLQDEFAKARLDLDDGRLVEAARSFDGVFEEAGWAEAAYNASLAYYGLGEYDKALTRSGRIVELLPDDLAGLHLHGVLLRLHGRYADAESVSGRALGLARSSGDRYAEAMGLLNLATSRRFLGRPAEAAEAVENAREIGESLGRKEIVAASWLVTGYLARARGDSAAAEAAFASSKKSGLEDGDAGTELDVALAAAEDALGAGDRGKARRLANRLLVDVRVEKGRQARAVHLLRLAELERDLGSDAGEGLLGEAEELFVLGGVDVGQADVLAARARWRLNDGDLAGAEALIVPCIAIREALQVPVALAGSRLVLAQVRLAQDALEEALQLGTQAAEVLGAGGQAREHRAALLVLSDVHLRRGDLEAALASAREVGQSAAAAGAAKHVLASQIQETLALARAGDLDGSLAAWTTATGPRSTVTPRQRIRGELALARAFEVAQRPAEALGHARRALEAITTAPVGALDDTSALENAAIEAVVASMLSLGDTASAKALLTKHGRAEGVLADYVRSREDSDLHNAAVGLYETGDLARARDAFRVLLADQRIGEGLRNSATRNLGAALEGLAREHLTRGGLADAERGYLELLELAKTSQDARVAARAGFRLAEIRSRVEDPEGGAAYAEAAASAAREASEADMEGTLWAMAGDLMFDKDPSRARVDLQKALGAWGTDDTTLGKRASVTYNLALLSYQLDDAGEAAVRVQEARILAGRAGRDDLVKMADELAAALKE